MCRVKQFFEAVYQRPFTSEVGINIEELIGKAVVAELDQVENSYPEKRNGVLTGNTIKGKFNNVKQWLPDTMESPTGINLQ